MITLANLNRHANKFFLAGLSLCFFFPVLFYGQALHSSFYLDDSANLESLANADTYYGLLHFVLNNETSRFLSYLSFVPQREAWIHQDPFPLKLFNLALHLFNTLLIYLLSKKLSQRFIPEEKNTYLLPLLVTFAWTTLPIHTSTILYTIQRMTLLSSSFTLAACTYIAYSADHWKTTRDYLISTLIIGVCYVLGILAKENAILIGAYTAAILSTAFSRKAFPPLWKLTTIWLPLLLTLAYLFLGKQLAYGGRDFTPTERLLSESVILFEYLGNIIVPAPANISLFNDNHPIIHTITEYPVLLAVSLLALAIALAIRYRQKQPVLAFGIAWFLGGHLLESTIVPLELYFEHRNYLPSFGVIFTLAFFLVQAKRWPLLRIAIAFLLIANSLTTLFIETRSWANPGRFALDALAERPRSERALHTASEYFLSTGNIKAAAEITGHAQQTLTPLSTNLIHMMAFKCLDETIDTPPFDALLTRIHELGPDFQTKDAIHMLYMLIEGHECAFVSYQDYLSLLDTLQKLSGGWEINYYQMHKVFIYNLLGDQAASQIAVKGIDIQQCSIDQGLFKLYMLMDFQQYGQAREELNILRNRFANSRSGFTYQHEFRKLETTLNNRQHDSHPLQQDP